MLYIRKKWIKIGKQKLLYAKKKLEKNETANAKSISLKIN